MNLANESRIKEKDDMLKVYDDKMIDMEYLANIRFSQDSLLI